MVDYKSLGFHSFEEYNNYFYENLMLTNKTYDYYVNWEGSKVTIKKYETEIDILNSLSEYTGDKVTRLQDLLTKYPKIIELIPCLISEKTVNKPYFIFDSMNETFRELFFNKTQTSKKNIDAIIDFAKETGIIRLLSEIQDLSSYIYGVYVGNNTNARKNRSGTIFENIIGNKLRNFLPSEFNVVEQDPNFSLSRTQGKKRINRHDFVIYRNEKPLMVVECNFYNDAGSKPNTISREYALNEAEAQKQKISFVWLTDGQGWKKMKNVMEVAMNKIDLIINYNMLKRIQNILYR